MTLGELFSNIGIWISAQDAGRVWAWVVIAIFVWAVIAAAIDQWWR